MSDAIPRTMKYATALGSIPPPRLVALLLASWFPAAELRAQLNYETPYFFTTLAGNSSQGSADGTGSAAQFSLPGGVAVGANGIVFVADTGNHTIRRIAPGGVVTTYAGVAGSAGPQNGLFGLARLFGPRAVAVDAAGFVYVADAQSQTIRKVVQDSYVDTLAGVSLFLGSQDSSAGVARFNFPSGIAVDRNSNVYVSDTNNHTIRKITPGGVVTTLAGEPTVAGRVDGLGNAARFSFPRGLAVDESGNVFVADASNNCIRKITPAGAVTTVAGTGTVGGRDGAGATSLFSNPWGLALDSSGNLFVTEYNNGRIRRISPTGVVSTLAGGANGGADGTGSAARFLNPSGIAVDASGKLYVADTGNFTIRVGIFPAPVPVFTVQPVAQPVVLGGSATLSATVTSQYPVSYQWQKDGVAIAGATAATLSLANLQPSNAGSYRLIATSMAGPATSAAALLSFGALPPPVFIAQPASQNVLPGASAIFTVSVASDFPVTYQWQKDGVAISGATAPTLAIASVQPANRGVYQVVARNAFGSATSEPATLATSLPGQIINLSILTSLSPAEPTFTLGTVLGGLGTGGPKQLLIRAAGPSLAAYGVNGAAADPRLDVFSGSTLFASNNNWTGSAALLAAFNRVGAFGYVDPSSLDAALLFNPGVVAPASYAVRISAAGTAGGAVLAEIYDATPTDSFTITTPRLLNVSVLKSLSRAAPLTAGFVIGGTTPKQVLVRAVGPTLAAAPFNLAGVLDDPQIELFAGSTSIATNDDWGGGAALSAAFASVGAFALPVGSKDAAITIQLQPGSYSARVTGAGAAGGLALVEVYDVP